MAHAQKTLSIVSANTAKKPAAKPAAKPAKWNQALFQRIIDNTAIVGSAAAIREKLDADIAEFRKYGVKVGDRRTCAVAQEFFAGFIAQGIAQKTATNYLSSLRESINKGTPFTSNPHRKQEPKGTAGKGKAPGKGKAATTYKNAGEVLEALAVAIQNIEKKVSPELWQAAMAAAPFGFDDVIADFLKSQALDDETETSE